MITRLPRQLHSFDPGPLAYATTYYWRIDEVNDDGTTRGATWSFTTEAEPAVLPDPATSPNPANSASELGLSTQLSWSSGALTNSHNVYFGTNSSLGAGDLQGSQALAATSFDPGPLDYSTTYYWRIDEVNGDGTTQGATWSFSTEAAPIETMNLSGLSGAVAPASRGRWTALVTIGVEDQGNSPEAGVTVDGSWSNGTSGSASCVTDTSGSCSVQKANLKSQVNSVTFTVSNLTKNNMVYNPADNVGSSSVIVGDIPADKTPIAEDDSYQAVVNTQVSGNVISNDDQGDGPASINSNTQPASGVLSLSANGGFTYTPSTDFIGTDSFSYTIIDQDGDASNIATVNLTVNDDVPPPPPPAERSISLRPFKVKGVQNVEITWLNFAGSTVEIRRDGIDITASPTANDGAYTENIGVKGSGQTYTYVVCEMGTGNCATDSVSF